MRNQQPPSAMLLIASQKFLAACFSQRLWAIGGGCYVLFACSKRSAFTTSVFKIILQALLLLNHGWNTACETPAAISSLI